VVEIRHAGKVHATRLQREDQAALRQGIQRVVESIDLAKMRIRHDGD
jgi:hypothetical protein